MSRCSNCGRELDYIWEIESARHDEIIERIKSGAFDAAAVDRFNELVKEGKIGYDKQMSYGNVIDSGVVYRLRPTPQYRPFTAVEAAEHFKRTVIAPGTKHRHNFTLSESMVHICGIWHMTYKDAVEHLVFTDTGEPFGVKEGG